MVPYDDCEVCGDHFGGACRSAGSVCEACDVDDVFLRVVSIRPTAAPARLIGSISNICCLTVPVGRHDPSETMASGFMLSRSSRVCRSVCGELIGCEMGGCCLLI